MYNSEPPTLEAYALIGEISVLATALPTYEAEATLRRFSAELRWKIFQRSNDLDPAPTRKT